MSPKFPKLIYFNLRFDYDFILKFVREHVIAVRLYWKLIVILQVDVISIYLFTGYEDDTKFTVPRDSNYLTRRRREIVWYVIVNTYFQ